MTKDAATLSGAAQVAGLQKLGQTAAAWLLGLNARSLRDRTDVPRNRDGSYDARRLLEWARERIPAPNLSDEDQERLLLIGEIVAGEVGASLAAILDDLDELDDHHGDAGLVLFARMLMEHFRQAIADDPSCYREPTGAELAKREAAEKKRQAEALAFARLQVAVVCDRCGKLRRGTRWAKLDPPAGFAILHGRCPRCDK